LAIAGLVDEKGFASQLVGMQAVAWRGSYAPHRVSQNLHQETTLQSLNNNLADHIAHISLSLPPNLLRSYATSTIRFGFAFFLPSFSLFLCVGLLILLPSAADVGNINNG
jgi:hypothetical protein